MTRPAVPMSLMDKKPKRSNAFIDERLEHEKTMKIGEKTFVITEKILQKKQAIAKWNELVKIFEDFDWVTNVDAGLIELYCLTFAEYSELIDTRRAVENEGWDLQKQFYTIDKLGIDNAINKKLQLLISMKDKLFLTPVSRMRTIPKKNDEVKEETNLEKLGFGFLK